MAFQIDFVRQHFPALSGDWIFFDNAGGSQTLKLVCDRITDFLLTSNVQLGASYEISQLASARVLQGREAAATLINAADPAEVVMGHSTSLLLRGLSLGLCRTWQAGDEVIVTNSDHEANVSPWVDLQRQGIIVKTWKLNPETLEFDLADLAALMTPRTRLVAMTHASNVLGTINSLKPVADLVHAHGALLCVDGVGYAGHRAIDVQAWDVDFYVFSFYKVYGAHHALLYGKQQHLLAIPGINHDFIQESDIPYKFQPGGPNYELSYSVLGLCDYLQAIAQKHNLDSTELTLRQAIIQAFKHISDHEDIISNRLLQYLASYPKVRVIGLPTASTQKRVPTISFVVEGVDSATIPPQIDPHRIGIRYGDFYAKRLIQDLDLAPQNGVVRVSMVHYNTAEEVDRLIECLAPILNRA